MKKILLSGLITLYSCSSSFGQRYNVVPTPTKMDFMTVANRYNDLVKNGSLSEAKVQWVKIEEMIIAEAKHQEETYVRKEHQHDEAGMEQRMVQIRKQQAVYMDISTLQDDMVQNNSMIYIKLKEYANDLN